MLDGKDKAGPVLVGTAASQPHPLRPDWTRSSHDQIEAAIDDTCIRN